MTFDIDFHLILPEAILLCGAIFMILVRAITRTHKYSSLWFIITIISSYIAQLLTYHLDAKTTLNSMYISDLLGTNMQLLILLFSMMLFAYMQRYIQETELHISEFYATMLLAIFGMNVLITANNMITVYLGLEILSLGLYGLIAMSLTKPAVEAAIKYFVLGSVASGIFLYGVSLVYLATGHLDLQQIFKQTYMLYLASQNNPIIIFGLIFVASGVAFKLGLAPFHMWMPDVYEGANLPVTSIIATLTKIAAFVFLVRVLYIGLGIECYQWAAMFLIMGYISIVVGNITAIWQTDIKRMLAYSAIANMGMLAFCVAALKNSLSIAILYLIAYIISAMLGFGALMLLLRDKSDINQLRGLHTSHPVFAALIAISMLSLAGIPPFIGFYAKFRVIDIMLTAGYTYSAIFVIVLSAIGAFYYLRIVKVMYFDEGATSLPMHTSSHLAKFALGVNLLMVILFSIMPDSLMEYAAHMY